MGCCLSEPIHESIIIQTRPRSVSFYIKNDLILKEYEDKVIIAAIKAQEEDSNIY
jgi:hypothetical protein